MINNDRLALNIAIAMFVWAAVGIVLKLMSTSFLGRMCYINHVLYLGGYNFISLMKVLMVPIVLVSIVCGVGSLEKNTFSENLADKLLW